MKKVWGAGLALLVGIGVAAAPDLANAATTDPAVTAIATADTYVSSASPTTSSGSLAAVLASPQRTGYFKFNVSNIPAGATITGATLKLTGANNTGSASTQPTASVDVFNVGSTWTEATTYNTRPALGAKVGSGTIGKDVVLQVPVTVGGNGLVSFAVTRSSTGTDSYIASSENPTVAARPALVVNYRTAAAPVSTTATDCTKYASTTGADSNAGTQAAPWKGVMASLNKLAPGDVLCLQPGTYTEEVVDSALPDGTAAGRITVKSYDTANRAVIDGRFSLSGLSFWTIRDLRFTNPTPQTTAGVAVSSPPDLINSRIVAFIGGNDSTFGPNNEIWNGRYAGLLLGRASSTSEVPQRWTVTGNYVHDTDYVNFYFNVSRYSTGNVIERNRFINSANSENLKVGWGGSNLCSGSNWESFGAGGVEVRYNTFHNNVDGAVIIAEPGGLNDVRVYRNMLTDTTPSDTGPGYLVRYDSVEGCLGDKVFVTDNWGYGSPRFSQDFGASPNNVAHETGNVFGTDPQLDADLVPQLPAAQPYGYAAP